MSDAVKWPAHYNQGDVECIDAMRAAFGDDAVRAHCVCNAFKYIWRANEKGARDQDVRKAIWYLRFAIGDDPRRDDRATTERDPAASKCHDTARADGAVAVPVGWVACPVCGDSRPDSSAAASVIRRHGCCPRCRVVRSRDESPEVRGA